MSNCIHNSILTFIHESYYQIWADLVVDISIFLHLSNDNDLPYAARILTSEAYLISYDFGITLQELQNLWNHVLKNCLIPRKRLIRLISLVPKLKQFADIESVDNMIDFFNLLDLKIKKSEEGDSMFLRYGKLSDLRKLHKSDMSQIRPQIRIISGSKRNGYYGKFVHWNGVNAIINITGIGNKSINQKCEIEVYWNERDEYKMFDVFDVTKLFESNSD